MAARNANRLYWWSVQRSLPACTSSGNIIITHTLRYDMHAYMQQQVVGEGMNGSANQSIDSAQISPVTNSCDARIIIDNVRCQ